MDYKRILWTSLLVLAAGIILLCYKLPGLDFFVRCLGWLFIAAAVLNIVMQFARAGRKSEGKSHASVIGMLTAVASGALGLWMVLTPGGFATAMVYIMGAMMILGGFFLIFTMAFGFRPVKFPYGFYILPALVAACGIVMCCISPDQSKEFIVMITAIAMIVFSVGALIEVAGLVSLRRSIEQAAKASAVPDVTVAPAEPVVEDVTPTDVTPTK